MIASDSNGSLREGIRRLLRNQWFVAVAIFVAAMVVRCGFHLCNPDANGFFIYHGSPISDGSSYTYKAINIAEGNGIPPGQQPAIRPFYSIVLACLYTWTGFSLQAVAALNIVIGGATAGLIYLCGARAINRFCGLGAASFFAIDPMQLIETPQACTEPLGLLFFVASVYVTLRAFDQRGATMFFLSGFFIGLSNLTRTLTLFTLPFYIGLIFLVGWRERRYKAVFAHTSMIVLGFAIVTLPWLIRQQRLYGILTISDNIGEAIYAATSRTYEQWTPKVRQDADAVGIPNTIGARYSYFINRAGENVKSDPGFYLGNVSRALWDYANTFGYRSRTAMPYASRYSNASQSQGVLLVYVTVLIIASWLLRNESPFGTPALAFLLGSLGLLLFYRVLPVWLTFVPVMVGIVFSWRSKHGIPALVMLGSLVLTVLGSAIFANPVLFRTILMTDWLFVLYFVAAIWFPAEILACRIAYSPEPLWAARSGDVEEMSPFQDTLFSLCRQALVFFLVALLGFFVLSAVRLIALTVSHRAGQREARGRPAWTSWSSRAKRLTMPERIAILRRLEDPKFALLPQGASSLPIFSGGKDTPKLGDYIVDVGGFYYDYYIPAGEFPLIHTIIQKPYARTLLVLRRLDFIIPGEIPSEFADQALIFVGVVVPLERGARKETPRPQVRGLAVIPFDKHGRPDFDHAFCAPACL